jgi:hypothetical protein
MGRMADAEKLSIPQLQQAIKNGTIPAYVGVPLLQDKVRQRQQAMAMQQAQQGQGQNQVPIAAQVMQDADQYRGIDELPTNLPTEEEDQFAGGEYASGGIIAFAGDGPQGQQVRSSGKSFWDTVDPSKYKEDPAYKAFADSPDITDKTYKNYLELGNTPPLTKDELSDARIKNANAVIDAYAVSPEGKQDIIQAQQMGEPNLSLPSKVREQYYTEATNDPKLSTRVVENQMGLDRGDLARMRGEDKSILTSVKEGASNLYDKVLGPKGISNILPEGRPSTKYAQTNSPIPGLTGIASNVKDALMTSPLGRTAVDKVSGISDVANKTALRVKLAEQYGPMALGTASGSDADQAMARQILNRLPNMSMEELTALAKQKGLPSSQVTLPSEKFTNRMSEAEAAQAEMLRAEAASPMGVAALPAAQNVRTSPNQPPAGQRGAAPTGTTTAPTGTTTAPTGTTGTTTSTGSSRGNGAGGNVPSTLREAEAIAGKSPAAAQAVSAVDRYMAMLEKSGESVGREKKEALYMALISGGLAAAGGTSPNALANIAAGMVPATQQYQKAISDIRKDDRERVEKLLAAGMGKEKLAMELRKLGIEEKKVDALVNYYNARAGAAGGSGDAAQDRIDAKNQVTYVQATRNFNAAISGIDAKIAKVKESQFYGMDPTKYPNLASKIKAANDTVAGYQRQKQTINKEHQGFVKQLGVNVPDYEGRAAAEDNVDLSQFFRTGKN